MCRRQEISLSHSSSVVDGPKEMRIRWFAMCAGYPKSTNCRLCCRFALFEQAEPLDTYSLLSLRIL
ncbi:MAG: hypothetical protein RBS30_05265, partial [Sphaerochaetaceae bacterium]|nr:hypothetical protein [Sphaerochaetaceae bacterium]